MDELTRFLASVEAAHKRKVAYNDKPAIREHARRSLGVDPESIRFGSITLNWRGAWSATSADLLKELGLRPVILS